MAALHHAGQYGTGELDERLDVEPDHGEVGRGRAFHCEASPPADTGVVDQDVDGGVVEGLAHRGHPR